MSILDGQLLTANWLFIHFGTIHHDFVAGAIVMERLELATDVVFLERNEVVAGTAAIPGLYRDGGSDIRLKV